MRQIWHSFGICMKILLIILYVLYFDSSTFLFSFLFLFFFDQFGRAGGSTDGVPLTTIGDTYFTSSAKFTRSPIKDENKKRDMRSHPLSLPYPTTSINVVCVRKPWINKLQAVLFACIPNRQGAEVTSQTDLKPGKLTSCWNPWEKYKSHNSKIRKNNDLLSRRQVKGICLVLLMVFWKAISH